MRKGQPKRPSRSPITAPFHLVIEAAQKKRAAKNHKKLGVNHWVVALRDLFPILPHDLSWDEVKMCDIRSQLRAGNAGDPFSVQSALSSAARFAKRAGQKVPTIDELAIAILAKADLLPDDRWTPPLRICDEPEFENAPAVAAPSDAVAVAHDTDPRAKRASRTTPATAVPVESYGGLPMLERFGRNLTRDAAGGLLAPVVGRQEQIALMMETLCRRTRRNIALVGQPGVGKRAIVEGLAQRIASGSVPQHIAHIMIIEVQLNAIIAGVNSLTEFDQRFVQILIEARTCGCALFFDDIRTVTPSSNDALTMVIANHLKPEISRGEITCIVSGAEEDYLRFVELDASLRPWFQTYFQPIRVDELTPEQTLEALDLIAAHTQTMTGVAVPHSVNKWVVAFAAELLKSHRFPGKAVDLIEQMVAHAITEGHRKVTLADAHEVAERAIAIPADMESRLRRITKLLCDSSLLLPDDQHALVDRLSVTLRSLDLVPARPNAMLLLVGEAAAAGRALAETLADAIAGSSDRVIAIDFGLLTEAWDMRQLLGIPGGPGAMAQHPELPLHQLLESPWSVLLCENIDGCHPQVRTSMTRALTEGYIIDARGKKIFMSDAVVLLTAPSVKLDSKAFVGFAPSAKSDPVSAAAATAEVFDGTLVAQMDLVVPVLNRDADLVTVTRQQSLIADLTKRYRNRGLDITWDRSILSWFRSEGQTNRSRKDWELWADRSLAAALIPHLPAKPTNHLKKVVVKQEDDQLVVGEGRASAKAGKSGN